MTASLRTKPSIKNAVPYIRLDKSALMSNTLMHKIHRSQTDIIINRQTAAYKEQQITMCFIGQVPNFSNTFSYAVQKLSSISCKEYMAILLLFTVCAVIGCCANTSLPNVSLLVATCLFAKNSKPFTSYFAEEKLMVIGCYVAGDMTQEWIIEKDQICFRVDRQLRVEVDGTVIAGARCRASHSSLIVTSSSWLFDHQ